MTCGSGGIQIASRPTAQQALNGGDACVGQSITGRAILIPEFKFLSFCFPLTRAANAQHISHEGTSLTKLGMNFFCTSLCRHNHATHNQTRAPWTVNGLPGASGQAVVTTAAPATVRANRRERGWLRQQRSVLGLRAIQQMMEVKIDPVVMNVLVRL